MSEVAVGASEAEVVRAWTINPVLVLLALAATLLLVRVVSMKITTVELCIAAAVAVLSAEAAVVPLFITRKSDAAAVAQAGLVSTVLHMMVCAAVGFAAAAVLHTGPHFIYGVLGFYWVTLVGVSMNAIFAIRAAPVSQVRTPV